MDKIRQIFRNNSNCYADTWSFKDDGTHIEGEVIQAITEDKFVEVVNEILKFYEKENISNNGR